MVCLSLSLLSTLWVVNHARFQGLVRSVLWVMFPYVSLCVAYRSPLCFCAQEVIEFMFASRYRYFAFSLSLSPFSVSSEVGKLAGSSGSRVCI